MNASERRAVITAIVSVAALAAAAVLVWAATTGPVGVVGELPRSDDVHWAADLFTFLLVLGTLWIASLALRRLVARLAPEEADNQPDLDVEQTADLEGARAALARDRERHQEALAEADIRNGVVACWVMLEEAAAGAGFPRRPSETPTEFVVHVLHSLDVDPRPVAGLAGLYHEARFSSHRLSADSRARAEAALTGIHAGLSEAAVAT